MPNQYDRDSGYWLNVGDDDSDSDDGYVYIPSADELADLDAAAYGEML